MGNAKNNGSKGGSEFCPKGGFGCEDPQKSVLPGTGKGKESGHVGNVRSEAMSKGKKDGY